MSVIHAPMFIATGPTCDPYWDDTVLLMHMNGANNSTTFTDELGHSFTAYNDAKISTAKSKFGGASAYFDGNADYAASTSADFDVSNVAFTIEAWVYCLDTSTQAIFGSIDTVNSVSSWSLYVTPGDSIKFDSVENDIGATYHSISSGTGSASSLTINAWHHVALSVEAGGDVRFFVDGVQIGTTQSRSWTVRDSTQSFRVGGLAHSVYPLHFYGYIDELRMTRGTSRYNANFSVPASAFLQVQC